ncbi:MAG: glycosyltransferase family 39 protein, partial [Candidatus Eisenbacteria bacterium]
MSPHGKETAGPRASARPDAAAGASATPRFARLTVPWLVVLLLAVHAAMVIPGIFRNSVTFDENFHLPAGALYLERGYTHVSVGQPPLARALYALPVMPLRPKLPPDSILVINAERAAGHSFLSLNADRFETLYITARFVALLMSLGVGILIFAFARSLYGPAAGLLALAAWVAMPEAVAQAGLIGMDLPTALVFLLVVMALRGLVMHGRLREVALMTLACGAALLTRYSVLQLVPVLIALAVWAVVARRAARPAWLFGGLIVAFLGAVVLLDLGYLGQISMLP